MVALHCSEFGHKDLKNVGNYQLGRLIGKGSFGKVYLATHKLTNGSKVHIHCPYEKCKANDMSKGRPQERQQG